MGGASSASAPSSASAAGWPKDAILSTKLDRDAERGNRFDAAQARRSLEASLKALGVDRVNILHLHDPEYAANLSEVTGPKGAIAELFKMKEEGLADAVGLAGGPRRHHDPDAEGLGFRRPDHAQPLHARQPQCRGDDGLRARRRAPQF